MADSEHTLPRNRARAVTKAHPDMETLVGYILLGGVSLSIVLITAGLIWRWLATGQLGLEYSISGMNLFRFVLTDLRQLVAANVRARLLVNLGLAVLLLTPYVRVLASMVYFAFEERNWKYTLFTGFVLSVLTYSLFLH
jgi:uncharacterized membrane protein